MTKHKMIKAITKGTIMFVIGLAFTFLVLNAATGWTQHKDFITVAGEWNEARLDVETDEGFASTMLSNKMIYSTIGIMFCGIFFLSCYTQYDRENKL